jgi:hypothetical protein
MADGGDNDCGADVGDGALLELAVGFVDVPNFG